MIVIDLETTGISITKDRIVQIGAIKIVDGVIKEEKNVLINPEMDIPQGATDVHGITNEDVKNAPSFRRIAKSLMEWLKGHRLCGYNSNYFDIPILSEEFDRCNIKWDVDMNSLIDVYQIEAALNTRKLSDVYKRYTGKDLDGAHDALVDVKATFEILQKQQEVSGMNITELSNSARGDVEILDLGQKFYKKDGVTYFNFGKHKDKPVWENQDYLVWMLDQDFPSHTIEVAKTLILC